MQSAPTRTVTQIVRANLLTRFNALLGAMLVVILLVGQFRDALFGFVLIGCYGAAMDMNIGENRDEANWARWLGS